MSNFWKSTFGVIAEVISVPANAVVSGIDSLERGQTFTEKYIENESRFKNFVRDAEEFGHENGHLINHGIVHMAKHLMGVR